MQRKWLILVLLAVLAVGSLPLAAIHAQDAGITLTLAVPSFTKDLYKDELFKKFEEAHPGVHVQVVSADNDVQPAVDGIDKHLTAEQSYVSKGDVVFVDSRLISLEATRAGLFLDLAPLVDEDKTINVDDFYPTMWKAFQWDKGVWALPTGGSASVMTYKPSAFDAAGLAYPSDKWTLDDWANAIRKLTQKDASGKVTVPGMAVGGGIDAGVLAYSLIRESLYDASTLPDTPQLQKDSVEKVLTVWNELDKDGYIGQDFSQSPMGIAPALFVAFQPKEEEKRQSILLPGGKAGLDVQGFAVSAGTPHAAEACALVNYLTTRAEGSGRFAGTPARKSLSGAPAGEGNFVGPKLPAEVQALTDQAIANGLNFADVRYTDYLELALRKMKSDNLDAHAALQLVQQQAVSDQQTAVAKKGNLSVTLATPAPVVVQPGKTTLKFGLTSFMIPLPNEDVWTKLAQDFAQNDPQVGKVSIDTSTGDLAANASKYDCFYLPYNGVPSANLTSLLNLDPYLTADKSFDKSDVVGDIMSQLERDGKTWGLPVMLQPELLRYDATQFSKANVPAPEKGWTIDAFADALKALKTANTDQTSFVAEGAGGTHLLMLIAAYGGLPFDYRTSPATLNFTDPETVQAIRQVLDLAKKGYIKYEALGAVGQVVIMRAGNADSNPPITTQSFGGMRVTRRIGEDAPDPYKSVTYPTGTKYNAISYGIGTAYISANTQSADACYRWISYIAQHPELFSAMPARRSLINAQATTASQGADVVATYNQIDALLKDSKTITFPSMFEGGSVAPTGFIMQHWLYEAFDNYVLHDADLDSALKDAENYAKTFQTCAANIPPYDPSGTQSAQEYLKNYLDCAVKADPRLKSFAEGIQ